MVGKRGRGGGGRQGQPGVAPAKQHKSSRVVLGALDDEVDADMLDRAEDVKPELPSTTTGAASEGLEEEGEDEPQLTGGDVTRLRPMSARMNYLCRADGSVALTCGRTVLFAGVVGPVDCPSSRRLYDRLVVDAALHPRIGEAPQPEMSALLQRAVERTVQTTLLPRQQIVLTVHETQTDGSLAAHALTAAGLALLDAGGVPMNGALCGVAVAQNEDRQLLLDPTRAQEQQAAVVYTFAFKSTPGGAKRKPECIAAETKAKHGFNLHDLEAAQELATRAARDIFDFYRRSMQTKLSCDIHVK